MAESQCLSLPANLEVRSSPACGRGLYAKEDISGGFQLLSSLQPLAHVAKGDIRDHVCQNCLRKSEKKLSKCGACNFVHYCSKKCQVDDWRSSHKEECAGINSYREKCPTLTPNDTILLIARLVTTISKQQSKKQQLEYLNSDVSDQTRKHMEVLVAGAALLLGDKGAHDIDVADVVAKADGNTFNVTVTNYYEEVVGVALYGAVSLVNHSCYPNSLYVFDGKQLTLRSMAPLKAGDEVVISYCELMDSRARRQAHLEKVYRFKCSCQRCLTEESEGSRWRMMYASKSEDVSEESKLGAMEKGFSLLDSLRDLEKTGDLGCLILSDIVGKCRGFMEESSNVLHPLNVTLTSARQLLWRAQYNLEQWQEALETGEYLTQAYREFLPSWHPVFLIHRVNMVELRRVLVTDDNLRASVTELREALQFTFGGGSALEGRLKP